MNKLVLGVAMVMAFAGVGGAAQNNMRDALAHLREARQALERAEDNKGGHKQRALDLIDKAIAQVQEGIEFAADKKR
jgi:hypothetical protein